MKIKKTLSAFIASTLMAVSLTGPSVTLNSNAMVFTETSTGVAWTPDKFDPNLYETYCPVAGLYKCGSSKVLITPDGMAYMKEYAMSNARKSYTGVTRVNEVDYTKFVVYQDESYTEYSEIYKNYAFAFDESLYRNIKGIAKEDQTLVKDNIEVGQKVYLYKYHESDNYTIVEQPVETSRGLSGTKTYDRISDYTKTHFKDLWPGDLDPKYDKNHAVNTIDLLYHQYAALDKNTNNICLYNADFNFDGKIKVNEVATLQNIILHNTGVTPQSVFEDEFGFNPWL